MLGLVFFYVSVPAWAQQGVLTSSNTRRSGEADRDVFLQKQVDQFIEGAILQTTIRVMGEVIERTARQANAALMPDFLMMAAQQGALQCFQQESVLKVIRGIYKEASTEALERLRAGDPSGVVQANVMDQLDRDLRVLVYDDVYQQIVQKVIEHVYPYQQEIIMRNVLQQQMQQMSQQQASMQRELVEQYQKGILVQ